MFKQLIEKDLKTAVKELGFISGDIEVYIPENPDFGDYTSNIALQLAKLRTRKRYQSAEEIANEILKKFGHPPYLERIEVAGPPVGGGFINFFIKSTKLADILWEKPKKKHSDKKILVEYASPNTQKVFHIGHLRNIITGEAIARLLEYQGKEVFRVTYTSDIGPSVAKALWGVNQLKKEYQKSKKGDLKEKAGFLGKAYSYGVNAYEENPQAKEPIDKINEGLYHKNSEFLKLWEETKNWSAAYFDYIYNKMGSEFDSFIWESEVEAEGKKIVEENIGSVFIKDQGAVIFPGKKYGLHNRVFITSKGNPTYEAKEIGVTFKEESLFPFDLAIHVVAEEQSDYFKVVIKAVEKIESRLVGKKTHLPYGFVNLTTGKMSSREGNIIAAEDLIDQVKQTIKENYPNLSQKNHEQPSESIAIGAIKFSFLKYSLRSDIAFDITQSISLQGDSGPYVLYAYARINSLLLNRATPSVADADLRQGYKQSIEDEEREILRQLEYFEGVVQSAAEGYKPNELCTYLLNLSKTFNLFYEKYPILGSEKHQFRLMLSKKVGETIASGLYLLGIETLEEM